MSNRHSKECYAIEKRFHNMNEKRHRTIYQRPKHLYVPRAELLLGERDTCKCHDRLPKIEVLFSGPEGSLTRKIR